ncbi:MAG: hypothetical protein KID00_01020 [Clostridium argentinense]|nr:hypothetical protein [Clostridium argentinense]
MNNYEKFMQLLNDKGHMKAMNVAVNLTPIDLIPDEVKPSVIKSCVGASISTILNTDPEIKQAFDKAACDLMLDQVVKDLNLKKDKNFKPTSQDLFAKSIADALFSNMFGK